MRNRVTTSPVVIGICSPPFERHMTAVASLLVAGLLLLSTPAPVFASVRDADRVDGRLRAELDLPKAAMPDVDMKAGALVTEDGRELWSRRPDDRRAMASLTKIMTAVVALEHSSLDERVTVTAGSTRVGESTSFLRIGESLPMSEMLEALLVKSGNDAGYAIASHVAGSEDAFVALMNAKAEELGLEHTHFTNSHGLDEKDHYSSARDLAVLARYAMTNERFRQVVSSKTATIGKGKRAEKVHNTNLLIGNYTGANGVKTGWTNDAGYCVIVSARRDGIELYAVVLGTSGELRRFREARSLLDFGFAHFRPQKLASAGTVVGEAPVAEYIDVTAPAAISEDTTATVFDLSGPITRSVSVAKVEAPVNVGQRIGVATFSQSNRVVATIPLVALEDVPDPNILQRIGIALSRAWLRLSGAAGA